MSLIKILENDGDIHVDDNHKVDDYKGYKVDDGHEGEAAVSIWKLLVVWVAVRGLGHQRVQHVIPPSRGHEPGEKY